MEDFKTYKFSLNDEPTIEGLIESFKGLTDEQKKYVCGVADGLAFRNTLTEMVKSANAEDDGYLVGVMEGLKLI